MMNIRPLLAGDAAAFHALRLDALLRSAEAFVTSHSEEKDLPLADVERRIDPRPGHAVFGAFEGATLLGVVGVTREPRLKVRHKIRIWGMAVAPAAQGRGVGRALMEAALAFARATEGVAKVMLSVDAANVPAIALYESLGFVVFGREQDAVRIGEDVRHELQMALPLG